MGQKVHQVRGFMVMPRMIAMRVVITQIETKIAPMAIGFAPDRISRYTNKAIKNQKNDQRNTGCDMKRGAGLFTVALLMTMSRNAPRGHQFQHQ